MKAPSCVVAVLVYEGLCSFEYSCVAEVLGRPRPELGADWYRFETVAVGDPEVAGNFGFRLQADHGLSRLEQAGTVVLPGWTRAETPVPGALLSALRDAHARGARLVAVSSASLVLAATGLLDDRRATTHWRYVDLMRRRYPRVRIDPNVLYVEEGQLITSAGGTAALDTCLHMVRDDFGSSVANQLGRRLVIQSHRHGAHVQIVERPVSPSGRDMIATTIEAMMSSLQTDFHLSDLAQKCAMSERTFMRRFKQKTGMTPFEWLSLARVDRARELLETSTLPLEIIACECGLGSAANLRHHFQKRIGVSPSGYRKSNCATPNRAA